MIATKIARQSVEQEKELFEWTVEEINQLIGEVKFSQKEWKDIINPRVFVERRIVRGGPSPIEVKRMIKNRLESAKEEAKALGYIQGCLSDAKKLLES